MRGEGVLERFVAGRAVGEGVKRGTEQALVDLEQACVASANVQAGELFARLRRGAGREQSEGAVDRVFARAALPDCDQIRVRGNAHKTGHQAAGMVKLGS